MTLGQLLGCSCQHHSALTELLHENRQQVAYYMLLLPDPVPAALHCSRVQHGGAIADYAAVLFALVVVLRCRCC